MQLALTLLLAALGLLNQINNSTNVTPEFRLQVETIAHQAIDFAQTVIAKGDAPVVVAQAVVPVITPVAPVITAPVAPTVPVGAPVVVIEQPYPVSLYAPDTVSGYSGNCGIPALSDISVKYSDGKYRGGDSIQVIYPNGVQKTIYTNRPEVEASPEALLHMAVINFPADTLSGTTTLIKGSLKKEVAVSVRPLVISKNSPNLLLEVDGPRAGKYTHLGSGNLYNPDTYQCN